MTEARPPCGALLTAAKGRHALGREILVYALLPLHCALGYLMYTGTHTLSLALTNRLQLSGSFDDLGPTIYVQASVSILAAILLAVAALVLVPLLAGYYLSGAASGGLAWRVARVTGGQLLYLGMVEVFLQISLLGRLRPTVTMLAALLLGATSWLAAEPLLARARRKQRAS